MKFIKIGDRIINLSTVRLIRPALDMSSRPKPGVVELLFDGLNSDEAGVQFKGEEATALLKYFEGSDDTDGHQEQRAVALDAKADEKGGVRCPF